MQYQFYVDSGLTILVCGKSRCNFSIKTVRMHTLWTLGANWEGPGEKVMLSPQRI